MRLLDFCKRVDGSVLNRRLLEHFVKAGAFDWTGLARAELFERLDDVLKLAQGYKREQDSAQMGLFAAQQEEQAAEYNPRRELKPEWPVNIKLAHEKEALGFYLSGHPLEKFKWELQRLGTRPIVELRGLGDGSQVTVGGVVTFLKLKNTKKGDRYATFVLEDLKGTAEVIVWPDVYQKVSGILTSEDPVLVTGKLDVSDERCNLIAVKIQSAIELRDETAKEALLMLDARKCSEEKLAQLKSLLASHHGAIPVKLVIRKPAHSETVVALSEQLQVEPSEKLCNQVEALFGEPVMTFR